MNRQSPDSRGTSDLGDAVRDFFKASPGALKDHLNTEELVRITITSFAVGGLLLGLLPVVLVSVGADFPAPTDAAFAGLIVTLIHESLRRLGHGQGFASRQGAWEARPAGRPGLRDSDPNPREREPS